MTTYTKTELQRLHSILTRIAQPLSQPLTIDDRVAAQALLERTATMIERALASVERGARVLEWRINTAFAPTMNELAQWHARQPWRPKKTRDELEEQIRKLLEASPVAALCGAQLRRWVRVTRFTTQPKNVDDEAIDLIGGKMPIDMLRRAGVLVNDSPQWVQREAHVMKTTRGNTHVLVEVFEVAEMQVHRDPPQDGPAPSAPLKKGKISRHIIGDDSVAQTQKKERRRARSAGMNVTRDPPPFGAS